MPSPHWAPQSDGQSPTQAAEPLLSSRPFPPVPTLPLYPLLGVEPFPKGPLNSEESPWLLHQGSAQARPSHPVTSCSYGSFLQPVSPWRALVTVLSFLHSTKGDSSCVHDLGKVGGRGLVMLIPLISRIKFESRQTIYQTIANTTCHLATVANPSPRLR